MDYLVDFFSTLTDQFLNSDYWLEQRQDQDSIYYKFLEILSYVFICWAKVLECKLFTEIATHDLFLVPLVHNHSQFFNKSSHSSSLLQAINLVISMYILLHKNINPYIKMYLYVFTEWFEIN